MALRGLGRTKAPIIKLLGHCKGGNFNIHILAWFGFFICSIAWGNQVRFIIGIELSCNKCANHEIPDHIHIYAELIYINPQKSRMHLTSAGIFETFLTNSVDPDQSAHVGGAV